MRKHVLETKGICKSFFSISALNDVDIALQEGRLLGLIGENGAGKSTLMNIIGGVISQDRGELLLDGQEYAPRNPGDATRAGIAFIHQELNLFTNLSVAENIFIDNFPRLFGMPLINGRTIRERTKQLLTSVDLRISPDTVVEKLTPGERQLVEIAKALSVNARIIIFDEPTTSLTARETDRLFDLIQRLRAEGRSIIYISHILGDVLRLADDIAVLRDGVLVSMGPKEDYTVHRMISLMVGRDIEQIYPEHLTKPSDKILLEVEELTKTGIVRNISFSLHEGEVLGLFGLMGSGRTELARILFGLDPYEKGRIRRDQTVMQRVSPVQCIERRMAFVTENRREEGLLMDVTITENIGLVSLPAFSRSRLRYVDRSRLYGEVDGIARQLRIKSDAIERNPAKSLSGGNQQKAVVGKWLMAKPAVFILDEPTRGIDVGAKFEVYNIINGLAAGGTGVLFISSEIEELIGICDRILVMSRGEILGGFDRSEFDRERIMRVAFREKGA